MQNHGGKVEEAKGNSRLLNVEEVLDESQVVDEEREFKEVVAGGVRVGHLYF